MFLILETNKFLSVCFQFERSVKDVPNGYVPSCVTQGNWRPGQLANIQTTAEDTGKYFNYLSSSPITRVTLTGNVDDVHCANNTSVTLQ